MLTRDHRNHPNNQIDRNKRDPWHLLCPRELLKRGLNHPARRTCRGREHSHDGAVQAQQAAERRWVCRGWMVVVVVVVVVGLLPRALIEGEGVL